MVHAENCGKAVLDMTWMIPDPVSTASIPIPMPDPVPPNLVFPNQTAKAASGVDVSRTLTIRVARGTLAGCNLTRRNARKGWKRLDFAGIGWNSGENPLGENEWGLLGVLRKG
ncbi:MAG: hypothetical protein LBK99_15530 [Opitutaceae bacterium]|nr:hypothetical protein [Opitutaceae bacterium]